ncbi:transcriptional regulator [Embleya sp. NPDC050154]|uniref:transcriptional regulator n=1 Tax=Embleya sp. NPDC050154 TaxID=3363988 RepID=UPI0037A54B44
MQRRTFLAGAAVAGLTAKNSAAYASSGSAAHLPDPAAYIATTARLRSRYWIEEPGRLLPVVAEHARNGARLLAEGPDGAHQSAIAETALLASRIAFFDLSLRGPHVRRWQELALDAADRGRDGSLAAAVLGHMAFAPAWTGRGGEARDTLAAARERTTSGDAGPTLRAWLDAISAEAEVRLGTPDAAFPLLDRAADTYAPPETPGSWTATGPPAWLDWFSAARLEGFRGAAEVAAGRSAEARASLERTLAGLPAHSHKQRAMTLAELAATAVGAREPQDACRLLEEALDLVGVQGYATAVDRVRTVRASLAPWAGESFVRDVDDRLRSGGGGRAGGGGGGGQVGEGAA